MPRRHASRSASILAVLMLFALSAAAIADPPREVQLSPEDVPQPLTPKTPRGEAELDAVHAAALFAQARVLYQREDYEGALRRYQRAWRYAPHVVPALREIVPLAVDLEREAEAARYALIAAELDPRDEALLRKLASYVSEQGDYARAVKLYEKSLTLHRDPRLEIGMVLLHLEMGRLHFLLNEFPQAAEHLKVVRQALEQPEQAGLTPDHQKLLLGKAEITYALLGEAFFQAGQFDAAAAMFEQLHATKPNAGLLAFHLARNAAGRGQRAEALEKIREYVRAKTPSAGTDPYELYEKLSLEGVVNTEGAKREVREQLVRWQADDPANAALAMFLAGRLRAAGELDAAAKLYSDQLKLQPLADAYQGLAAVYLARQQYEPLLKLLGEASLQEGNLELVAEEVTSLAKNAAELDKFLALAVERTAHEPALPGAALAAALLAIDGKKFDAAATLFERAIAAGEPKKSQVLLVWGLGLFLAEQNDAAAKVFQRAIDEKALPDNAAHVHFLLANALEMAGHTEQAWQAANQAVALRPQVPRYESRRAWIRYHAKQYDRAEKAYLEFVEKYSGQRSPELREELREAKLALSHLCTLQNRLAEAEEWLEQVLDEFPEDISAANDLSYLWSERGLHKERALRLAQHAVQGEPKNEAYRDSLGWAYYQLQRYPEAVKELELAAAMEKPDGVILDHLGDALWKAGQHESARAAWTRAVEAYREAQEPDKQKRAEEKLQQPGE